MADWAIPQQAKLKYTQLFNQHDRTRSGFLSGVQCRDILLQSGLPRNVLAQIWNLSDIDSDGRLAREEFILALHLTNHVRAGHTLPSELPPELIPPSQRRTSSTTSTTPISTSSAMASVKQATSDTQLSQTPAYSAASVLNTNSFEDKRRENFEKGKAELERRRQKVIDQQYEILKEQYEASKKQVTDAKAGIDSMRPERDAKMGFITSLQAQIKSLQDRKVYLRREEQSLLAIAKDMNLVGPSQAEVDQLAAQVKKQDIDQMKTKIIELTKDNEQKLKELEQCSLRLLESKKELKNVAEDAEKLYARYKEKIESAAALRDQFAGENKAQIENLDSVWSSLPAYNPDIVSDQSSNAVPLDDPWLTDRAEKFLAKVEPSSSFNAFDAPPTTDQTADIIAKCESLSLKDNKQADIHEPRKLYKALYAFEARNPDELTINPGDIITASNEPQEPGWLSGSIGARSGLFPQAYVEQYFEQDLTRLAEAVMAKKEPEKEVAAEISYQGYLVSSTTQQSSAIATAADALSQKPVIKYKAIFAFEARNPDELTINPGDIVIGSNVPHEPGWLSGTLNGKTGLFPEPYVEQIESLPEGSSETVGTLKRMSSVGSLRSKKSKAKKAEVATVLANYRALGPEQLSLEKGQLVSIRRKMDSGWWEGEVQIKGKKKQYGWFPANYVKLLSTNNGSNNNDEPHSKVPIS